MEDADSKIQAEESLDEDIIRFDISGTEQVGLIDNLGLEWRGWSENESNGKQGIQYGALTANLIRAVQKQQQIIEDLNKRLEKIESMLLKDM